MQQLLDTALNTLTSPMVLFFVLGVLAGLARSDLEIPEPVGKAISLYLMLAIGFRGGVELRGVGLRVAAFGIYMPLIGACMGLAASTFPFNLVVGIPLYESAARLVAPEPAAATAHDSVGNEEPPPLSPRAGSKIPASRSMKRSHDENFGS